VQQAGARVTSVAIMQPYTFPYLGYFQMIDAADHFVLYDDLQFSRSGWVHRNRLLRVNGRPFYFTLPARPTSHTAHIRDVELAPMPWRQYLLKSVEANYHRCPYFTSIWPMFEQVVGLETSSLAEFAKHSVVEVARYLGIETPIDPDPPFGDIEARLVAHSDDLERAFPEIRLSAPSRKLVRVIALVNAVNADTLINLSGGAALYPRDEFKRNGLRVRFINMDDFEYEQRSTRFWPRLSILDVLMNCGLDTTRSMLDRYQLTPS
jgi:hypothetical protein